jgi:putative tryptophan/tyrosine transport system substrate-binding protein
MRRREFIAGFGGAAAWSCTSRAQSTGMKRVGLLEGVDAKINATNQPLFTAFREGLAKLGWFEARNLQIDIRFSDSNSELIRAEAAELVSLSPSVIVTDSAATTRAVQQLTRTIPIVMTGAGDVIANGIVKSVARPEGNVTGVTNLFASIGGKWLQLLREIAPTIERIGLLYKADVSSGQYLAAIKDAARIVSVEAVEIPYRDAADLPLEIKAFAAAKRNSGLIMVPPPPVITDRETIYRLAAENRLPAIFQEGRFATEGGLMAYGSDNVDLWRRASFYVDQILRGAKVNDLPIEYPTKFRLVLNLKTAKALGLTVPNTLLAAADEVIQ